MDYELTVLQEVTFKTDSLQTIIDKFYNDCSWHLTINVKDKNWLEAEIVLEVNDMEANIMLEYKDISTEWYSYDDYEELIDDLKSEWFDIDSLTLI